MIVFTVFKQFGSILNLFKYDFGNSENISVTDVHTCDNGLWKKKPVSHIHICEVLVANKLLSCILFNKNFQ